MQQPASRQADRNERTGSDLGFADEDAKGSGFGNPIPAPEGVEVEELLDPARHPERGARMIVNALVYGRK